MPPKFRFKNTKSFRFEPMRLSVNDPFHLQNVYKIEADITDNLRVHGVVQPEPRGILSSYGRQRPGVLRVLGIGTLKKRENPYNHPDFPEVWEPKEWDDTRGTFTPGQLKELIFNAGEAFPETDLVRGIRTTGPKSKPGRNPLVEIPIRRENLE